MDKMASINMKDLSWLSDFYSDILKLINIQTLLILGFVAYLVVWALTSMIRAMLRSFVWMLKVTVYVALIVALVAVALSVNPELGRMVRLKTTS
ncbi:hypothetical protein BC829DRAFT_402971 [Chytridium lagenaria]|nr:hypothetical protein BC829DRAFT_402971 [Chytridium lagenaria]